MTTVLHLPSQIAALAFIAGIVALFWLDRTPQAQTSKALWIPTAWLMITGSRPVSMWLGMSPTVDTAEIYLEGSPIDRAVFMFLVAAGLVVVISRYEHVGPILSRNWPIGLFFAYAALSVLWSDYPSTTFKHWIKGVGDVLMVLIVVTEPNVTDAIKRLITRVGFVLLPLSVLFIKYYPALGRSLSRSWTMNFGGVTLGKNELGGLCMIFGLGLLWRFRGAYSDREEPTRRRRLLALGAVLGMVIWLLWMCNSLTSTCTLTMMGAVMLLSGRPAFRRKPALVHVLVVTVLGIAVYALFFQSSAALVQDLGRDPTLTGRTEIWRIVLSVPVSRLLGAGYESFWLGQRYQEVNAHFDNFSINEAHNGYIEMLLNLGWIGVSLLAILIVAAYRNVMAFYSNNAATGGLMAAYLLSALIVGFTEAAFRMMGLTWIFFLLAIASVQEPGAALVCGHDGSLSSERLSLAAVSGSGSGAAITDSDLWPLNGRRGGPME